MMSSAIIIPARYTSERLPGKVLLSETGKYLIQYVWEQAHQAKRPSRVIIAADDERVVKAVKSFGGEVVLTSSEHSTGTDRVAEVARNLDAEIIVNLQGDEPEIEPASIDLLIDTLSNSPDVNIATLAARLHDYSILENPNVVKVVKDLSDNALYFSRSEIPYERSYVEGGDYFFAHIGIYAYRRDFLLQLVEWEPTLLEKVEKLEQLRILERGHKVRVVVIDRFHRGVDTPEDYKEFTERHKV
jgi:3-deoxy-manno-octulosonate cytidylyltransferase (CMP-KDO synthetase)